MVSSTGGELPVYFICSQVPTASVEPHAKVNRAGSFQVRIWITV